jgi:hypothetical protein
MKTNKIWTIITGICVLITVYQTYVSHEYSKKVNKAKGIFKKSTLELGIFDLEIPPKYIIVSGPIEKNKMHVFPFYLNLTNSGDKTAKDIDIVIRIEKRFVKKDDFSLNSMEHYNFLKEIKHKIFEDDKYIRFIVKVDNINPKEKFIFKLPLFFIETGYIRFTKDMNVTIANKSEKIRIAIKLKQFLNFQYSVIQKDKPSYSKDIKFLIIDTANNTLEKILELHNQDIQNDENEKYEKMNFKEKIIHRYTKYTNNVIGTPVFITKYKKEDIKQTNSITNLIDIKKRILHTGAEKENGEIIFLKDLNKK